MASVKRTTIKFRQGRLKFGDAAKQKFIEIYRNTGRWNYSAEAAGVSGQTVKEHMKSDEEFRLAVEEAKALYADSIEKEIQRRGVEGWEEPVFNYKDGSVLGVVRKFSDRMLEMLAKRHIAEYRERTTGDVNVGGVLVVNAPPLSAEEWSEKHKKKIEE